MLHRALLFAVLLVLLAPPVLAEEPEEKPDPIPPMASDEEAKEALTLFKDEWKARGYKGDEKTAVRERAMRKFAETQHPIVTERLYKLTGDRNEDISTLAVMYLGRQRALPGYAGKHVLKAAEKHQNDPVFVMFAVDAISELDYRLQIEFLRKLLKHKDEMVRKVAILKVGDMKEMRMFEDLLQLAKDLKIDKGWKTEGHEVRVDTGAAGDKDQKAAEAKYKQKYGNSARKARSSGRAMRDLKPILLESMKRLTGEEFFSRKNAEDWAKANAERMAKEKKALTAQAMKQRAEAAALK